jgi:glycerophosphoryl diester phosphodiesterase
MITAYALGSDVVTGLRRYTRPLLTYHLFFSLLTLAVLAPLSAWLLTGMLSTSGRPMVSDEDIVRFAVSLPGVTWLLAAGTLGALLVFLEHAGMMIVAADPSAGRYRTATVAIWQVGRQLHRLGALAGVMVAAHMAVAAPFLLGIGGAYLLLLGEFDPYYLVSQRPLAAWAFIATIAPFVAGIAVCNGMLYVRWILALPAVLIERRGTRDALRRSAELTAGSRLRIAAFVIGLAAIVFAMPLLLSFVFEGAGRVVLGPLPERTIVLVPAIVLFLAAHAVLAFVVTFVAVGLNSMLAYKLYLRAIGRPPVVPRPMPPRGTGVLAWSTEAVIVLIALGQAGWALASFDFRDDVRVIAHRGSSMAAPENTLGAIERAVADGADFVEIDVRQTADGALVLLHDRDLRRVAGDSRAIWELTSDEARTLDVGGWFGPDFRGERMPTLAEAVEAVRGRAQLYVEIKPSVQTPGIAQSVIDELRRLEFLDHSIIAALDAETLADVAEFAPEVRRALLVHSVIGEIDRAGLHALGLRAALVTPAEVVTARRHGHQLHVWTVNRPGQMSRFIDMGVDGIITDRPDLLAGLLAERAQLSQAELLLVKIRNWLWQ